MAEKIEDLTCPKGHQVEVHYEADQKAEHWQCPDCVADPDVAVEDTLVPFKAGSK